MDDHDKTPVPALASTAVRAAPPGPTAIPVELSGVGPPSGAPSSSQVNPGPPSGLPQDDSGVTPDYLPPGLVVDRWVVEKKLGQGGMGAVYRVHHEKQSPALPYALKMSLPSAAESDDVTADRVARFQREAATLLMLQHPNIIKTITFFTWPDPTSGHPCLVMPYVQGETLDVHCRGRSPSLRTILGLMREVADALDYIHAKAIFHRDIKPTNIMVRDDGVPLLMDFGIVKAKGASTRTTTETITTFEYGAPEYLAYVASDECAMNVPFQYEAEADLFCLGGTFFTVLTGRLPYQDTPGVSDPLFFHSATFQRAVRQYVPDAASLHNPAVTPEVDALLLRLMAGKPGERFSSAALVVQEIDALLERLPSPDPGLDIPFSVPPRASRSTATTRGKRQSSKPPSSGNPPPGGPSTPGRTPKSLVIPPPSGASPAPASEAFRQPTAPGAKVAPFEAPLQMDEQAVSQRGEAMPTAIRQAQERLRASGPPTSGNQRLLVGGLALLIAVLLVVIVSTTQRPAASPPQSLLDPKDPGAVMPTTTAALPQPVMPMPTEAEPVGEPGAEAPPPIPVASKGSGKRAPGKDSEAVEALLQAEYGGVRPTAGAEGVKKPSKKSSWVVDSSDPTDDSSEEQKKSLGVPTGTEMAVRLQKPLDSRTVGSGPAIAKLVRPLVVRGAVTLPSGTMVYGIASATGAGRFDARFTRLRLPDGRELPFEGIAYDLDDKKPGLRASSRLTGAPAQQASVGETVLKGAAGAALGKVAGSDGVDLATGAGQTLLAHDSRTGGGTSGEALLLEAPLDFTILAAAAF